MGDLHRRWRRCRRRPGSGDGHKFRGSVSHTFCWRWERAKAVPPQRLTASQPVQHCIKVVGRTISGRNIRIIIDIVLDTEIGAATPAEVSQAKVDEVISRRKIACRNTRVVRDVILYIELQAAPSAFNRQTLVEEVLRRSYISMISVNSPKVGVMRQIIYRIENQAVPSAFNRQTLIGPVIKGASQIAAAISVHDVNINTFIYINIEISGCV